MHTTEGIAVIIELGDNGLRSRYHWTMYDIDDGAIQSHLVESNLTFRADDPDTVASIAAYLAVRSICSFLTDGNHDWIARDYGPCAPEYQALKDLTRSSRYSIVIQHKDGEEWYGYRYWFHFAYRVPGQSY